MAKKRVAAYIRTGGGMAQEIFDSGIILERAAYEEKIKSHEGWELAGVYAECDSGCWDTGKRPGLSSLLTDCRAGKGDMIITKNVSRLHRNVMECVRIAKELRELTPPVGIIFEQEGLSTLDEKTPQILKLLMDLAAAESAHKNDFMRGGCNYLQHQNKGGTENV
jgi:DNA invertase Pin-like site-specific DNA recombinase